MKNIIIIILLGSTIPCLSQQIINTDFYQSGKQLVVTYDLIGTKADQTFDISLYVSTDNGSTWQGPLEQVSGDVGDNRTAGRNSRITWNVLQEFTQLKGKVGFRVQAKVNTPAVSDFIEMVYVQGGTFQMGSNEYIMEKPIHSVTVSDFYIGKYEVTQKQWRDIMGTNPSDFNNCDNCPVEQVSWNDVQDFIEKLNAKTGKNYRLPTEAEWEYAARGGQSYKYAGSDNIGSVAWNEYNSGWKIHPVGQKSPNGYGLYDMSGNVWEWCSDWYDSDYYENSPQYNPKGASSGSSRVLRGGSFGSEPADCSVASRYSNTPTNRFINFGFRLVFP